MQNWLAGHQLRSRTGDGLLVVFPGACVAEALFTCAFLHSEAGPRLARTPAFAWAFPMKLGRK
jgi:hypothetical protein